MTIVRRGASSRITGVRTFSICGRSVPEARSSRAACRHSRQDAFLSTTKVCITTTTTIGSSSNHRSCNRLDRGGNGGRSLVVAMFHYRSEEESVLIREHREQEEIRDLGQRGAKSDEENRTQKNGHPE